MNKLAGPDRGGSLINWRGTKLIRASAKLAFVEGLAESPSLCAASSFAGHLRDGAHRLESPSVPSQSSAAPAVGRPRGGRPGRRRSAHVEPQDGFLLIEMSI